MIFKHLNSKLMLPSIVVMHLLKCKIYTRFKELTTIIYVIYIHVYSIYVYNLHICIYS